MERDTEKRTIVWVILHKGSVEWKIGNDVHLRYTSWGFSLDQCLCGMSSLTFPVVLGNALGLCQCHSPALPSTALWKSWWYKCACYFITLWHNFTMSLYTVRQLGYFFFMYLKTDDTIINVLRILKCTYPQNYMLRMLSRCHVDVRPISVSCHSQIHSSGLMG